MAPPDSAARAQATPEAVLEIDLGALAGNYRRLATRAAGDCAAVVKADAYGLGQVPVARILYDAGCRFFFVAHLNEALALRAALPGVDIAVLSGVAPEDRRLCLEHRILPVVNRLADLRGWAALGSETATPPPLLLHYDTGMRRLGLDETEAAELIADPSPLAAVDCRYVMTHLACADTPDHPLNAEQRDRFTAFADHFPTLPRSIANSPGLFMVSDFHGALSRPGAALYGVDTSPLQDAPMRPVVHLKARVLQMRDIGAGESVGYGGSYIAPRTTRVATISLGYADGYFRALSNTSSVQFGRWNLPVIGRISMDLITLDASHLPPGALECGDWVAVLNSDITVNTLARAAGTIGYEILTALGNRFARSYVDADQVT